MPGSARPWSIITMAAAGATTAAAGATTAPATTAVAAAATTAVAAAAAVATTAAAAATTAAVAATRPVVISAAAATARPADRPRRSLAPRTRPPSCPLQIGEADPGAERDRDNRAEGNERDVGRAEQQ